MIGTNVARRYATALFELGTESSSLDRLVEEIGNVADAYSASAELQKTMGNPLVGHDAKRAILDDILSQLQASDTTKNAVRLLSDRRRLPALPAIAQLLRERADLQRGIVRAEVTTAVALSDGYYQRLQQQLESLTGKKVVLDRKQDPSIIAGVITRIGDTIVDGSLHARIQEMKNTLLSTEMSRPQQ